MKDCRAVSDELMKELKNGGFKEFVEFVKRKEKELVFCFRGNSNPKHVAIYLKNHYVWKLSIAQNKELRVTISFNHARFTKKWKKILKELYDYGFNISCDDKTPENQKEINNKLSLEELEEFFEKEHKSQDGYLTVTRKSFDKDFVKKTYKLLKKIIKDHFNSRLKTDYFKVEHSKKDSSIENVESIHQNKIEKERQHEIYLNNKNTKNGLFIYDLEFTQPNAKALGLKKNQPDMLAIRFENGKPKTLVLIEVKCTKEAMGGKSGLKEHTEKMNEYIYSKNKVIDNRREEATKIFEQYNRLGLRNAPKIGDIKNIPIEIGIILTDGAIAEYEKSVYSKEYEKQGYNIKEKLGEYLYIGK